MCVGLWGMQVVVGVSWVGRLGRLEKVGCVSREGLEGMGKVSPMIAISVNNL